MLPEPVVFSVHAVAVATIFCIWQKYQIASEIQRRATLRERVTYMLWTMANETD